MLRIDEIRALVQEHGPEGYLQIQRALLSGKEVNGRKTKVAPESFSFRALWEALVGPLNDTLEYAQDRPGFVERPVLEAASGAIASGAFPSAVGQLIAAKVIDGYNTDGYIGDQLVTTMPSKLRGERIVGFTSLQGPKEVEELGEYQESTFGEKYVTTTEQKRGRLLSISEEAIFFDQTGQILLRAAQMGELVRQDKERRIIRGVADVASAKRVYRPNGTGVALYVHATNQNLLAANTPLADWTDIQEALVYHATNTKDDREPDDEGGQQPIVWMPRILLTSVELAGVAAHILNATEIRTGSSATISANVLGQLVPGLRALSSPFLDAAQGEDQFDDASDWFIGDFQKQFIYKEIWPIQTLRAPMSADNEQGWRRDVVAMFKVREYGDINCIDHKYVTKVNAA